jgi:hypothetical protein
MLLLLPVSLVYSGVEYIQYILLSYSVVAYPLMEGIPGHILYPVPWQVMLYLFCSVSG